MARITCSKCKGTDHATKKCDKAWPRWEEQICDKCFEGPFPDAIHTCAKKSNDQQFYCKLYCGHCGDHNKQVCPIKVLTEDNVNQYTREAYEKAVKSGKVIWNQAPTPSSTSANASSPALGSREDMLKSMEGRKVTQALPITQPALTAEEEQKNKWAEANLDLAAYSNAGPHSDEEKKAPVLANSLRVTLSSSTKIKRYRILLGPLWDKEETPGPDAPKTAVKRAKKETIRAVVQDLFLNQFKPTHDNWASDFHSHIVCTGVLFPGMNEDPVVGESYALDHYRSGRDGTYQPMKSLIAFEGDLETAKLLKYVNPDGYKEDGYLPDMDLLMLNLITWKDINHRDFKGGRFGKKFFPKAEITGGYAEVSHKRKVIYLLKTGFATSIRPAHGQLILNVCSGMSAFFNPINLREWIDNRFGKGTNTTNTIPNRKQGGELSGVKVIFKGDPHGKLRTIRGFSTKTVCEHKFWRKIGNSTQLEEVTVLKNMVDRYPTIRNAPKESERFDKYAACVNLGGEGKNAKWYPADHLKIADWQIVSRTLDEDFQSQMVKAAQRFPKADKKFIVESALNLLGIGDGKGNRVQESWYQNFGLTIDHNFVGVVPRILFPAQLSFGLNDQTYGTDSFGTQDRNRNSPGSWNMSGVTTFLKIGQRIDHLRIIKIMFKDEELEEGEEPVARTRERTILHKCQADLNRYQLGLSRVICEKVVISETAGRVAMGNKLSEVWKKLRDPNKPNFVLVEVPKKEKIVYGNVKWWGDCKEGVRTMCVTTDKLIGKKKSGRIEGMNSNMIGNLALKMNFKNGGTNHRIFSLAVMPRTMVVGADVTHPGKEAEENCPSIAGVVATYDPHFAQYLASARLQTSKTEYIEELESMMVERLRCYAEKANHYPDHILFYRDGVSESQYGMVKLYELAQIRKAIAQVKPSGSKWDPKITLLVVGKRHNMRFYPRAPDDHVSLTAGHLIDSAVTIPHAFNFYLQSHDSALGTGRSAHYIVIVDESRYGAKKLHEATNGLCSIGQRACFCLSICAPAKFAGLLCDRLRFYMMPILKGNIEPAEGTRDTPQKAVAAHKRNDEVWGTRPGRNNPWHENMDDIMFYL